MFKGVDQQTLEEESKSINQKKSTEGVPRKRQELVYRKKGENVDEEKPQKVSEPQKANEKVGEEIQGGKQQR